jgi:xanthine dehydrogenase accessory factor
MSQRLDSFNQGKSRMGKKIELSEFVIGVRGGGDIASGVVWRLHRCGFKVFITEIEKPTAVRRKVAFCEAVYDGQAWVEGVEAILVRGDEDLSSIFSQRKIPLLVDPMGSVRERLKPDVIVDCILAKKNLGTSIFDAPLVIALGPGFEAGRDAHMVVETKRGHHLGRVISTGSAEPDTGSPGPVLGITTDRVLRASAGGTFHADRDIGDSVRKGDTIGTISGVKVEARIDGVLRGLIRSGIAVEKGLKIGDIDPRGERGYCFSISEKALAIGGGVLEGILRFYGCP